MTRPSEEQLAQAFLIHSLSSFCRLLPVMCRSFWTWYNPICRCCCHFLATGVLLTKSLPAPLTSTVFPMLSSRRLRVSVWTFRSLSPFCLRWAQEERYGSRWNRPVEELPSQHLLKRLSLLRCTSLATLSKSRRSTAPGTGSASSVVCHWFTSLFLCPYRGVLFCFDHCVFVIPLQVQDCDASCVALVTWDCFWYSCSPLGPYALGHCFP